MRGFLIALIMLPVFGACVRAETAPFAVQGWFGLEMFDDMKCANNPVLIAAKPGSDRLDLRWRKPVTYSDGTTTDKAEFRITAITGGDVRATRLRDGLPALFRFAPDLQSFDYLEGDAIDAHADPDLRVSFIRCEFQGS